MAGKHDSATATATATEASWRPFAQKLSGFMRHGSTKNRKVSPSQPVQNVGDIDRRSVFKLGRNSSYKAPSATETTFEFKPLEVDISKLESMRLAEGWLEKEPPPRKPDPEQLKKKPLPQPPPSSSTPIADLFASKAEFDSGLSLSTRRHTHLFLDRAAAASNNDAQTIARKPVPTSPAPTTTTTTTEPTRQPPATHQATYSILERGRPVEPKDVIPAEPVAALPTESQSSIAQKRRSLQSSQSNAGPSTPWSSASNKPTTLGGLDNRHSMFAAPVAASTTGRIEAGESASRPTTRSAPAANPLDRIQAWQKSITSAPVAPPPSNAVSPRGLAGNRLAWIRELEEKKSNDLRKDIGVLKKQAGGVSSKLAMFENKGNSSSAAPTSNPRMPPLSRSNSTTSRMSSVGLKSTTTNQDNATATPRTSIDTTRSSVHRNSGVMSYYDDSFREKMEGLVSQLAEKDDEEKNKANPAPRKRRITASFVSVEGGRKAAQAMAAAMLSGEKPQVAADSEAKAEEEKSVEAEKEASKEEVSKVEAAEPTPEPEQVEEAEKVEETAAPAEVEEVAAVETPAEAEAQPEAAAPEVAEEKVAEEVPAQEEPVVAEPEPEVAAEQSEPVVEEAAEEAPVAEPVAVEQETQEAEAAVEVPLPESDDEATVADEKSVFESVFEDAVEDQQAKTDI
ncbi:hypothetical protein PG985_010437 [Apiospora marii]|uniref:uncharacterized protein n=1 Tax=Apiospora marii TaxID=335849 RepID=UPI003131959B